MPRPKTVRSSEIEIRGPRVVLRPLADEDVAAIEPWYPDAVGAVHGLSRDEVESRRQPGSVGRGPGLDQGRGGVLPHDTDSPSTQDLYHRQEAARTEPNGGLLVIARRDDHSAGSGQAPSARSRRRRAGRAGPSAPIGLLDYRLGQPEAGWLTVRFIAIARAHRGWGYGSEAVRLVEAEAVRRWGAARFRACVDLRNGLGLYFWLRLGYRPISPLERPQAPGRDEGMVGMIRRIA